MKAPEKLTVNEQIDHLRKQVLGLILAGFLIIIIAGGVAVYYYQRAEHDLHVGSCKGRLSLIRTLEHARDVTLANPTLTAEQKKQTAAFYEQTIDLTDVSDCGDVSLPPPPSTSTG